MLPIGKGVRLYRNMPGIVPILREPNNTQYIPILAGLAERQSSNLFQYLQKSCSRIANIPFGGSTRPVICRSGRPKSLIDPIEPPTIAQECCAITQIRRNVRLERFSEPPTRETDVRYASESIFPILAGLAAGPILQYIVQYLQERAAILNIHT